MYVVCSDIMSYLIPKTILVHRDQYEKLRKQKGGKFNFSQWVRACIAAELNEDVDFDAEAEYKERMEHAPRVKLPDGKELIVVDEVLEEAQALSEDEKFILQVEEYMEKGYPVPPKTKERYEEAKKRVKEAREP